MIQELLLWLREIRDLRDHLRDHLRDQEIGLIADRLDSKMLRGFCDRQTLAIVESLLRLKIWSRLDEGPTINSQSSKSQFWNYLYPTFKSIYTKSTICLPFLKGTVNRAVHFLLVHPIWLQSPIKPTVHIYWSSCVLSTPSQF